MNSRLLKNYTKNKTVIHVSILSLLFVSFLVLSFLYVKSYNIIFPIINALILLSHFFLFKGKYRLYGLFLYMPFVVFFNYKPLGIGSFYSYIIIFYCIIVIFEKLFSNKTNNKNDIVRVAVIAVLALYSILLSLVFSGLNGFVKSVSIFAYLSSIALFIIDNHSYKNKTVLITITLVGMVMANLFACTIIYVLKGDYVISFLKNFLAPVYYRQYISGNSSFRYPGLSNDPNYLGMNVLVLTSIVLLNFKHLRFKVFIGILTALLQVFPILGASRNYFVCLVFLLIITTFVITVKVKNGWLISVGIYGGLLFILIIFGNTLLSQVILRIVSVDGRESLLDSLLSGRANLQMRYLSDYLLHPDSFIFGKGFGGSLLEGDSAHSIFVMSFRYFGIIGTILYYFYMSSFINFKICKDYKIFAVPIIILLIYGVTIDYISYSEMTLFLIFIYSQSFVGVPNKPRKKARLEYENYSISI